MNYDSEFGYINSNLNKQPILNGGVNSNYYFGTTKLSEEPFYTGAYIKPGVKFFWGQDYTVRGLRYAHPIQGKYVRFDLVFLDARITA